jgi:hypothetical protein
LSFAIADPCARVLVAPPGGAGKNAVSWKNCGLHARAFRWVATDASRAFDDQLPVVVDQLPVVVDQLPVVVDQLPVVVDQLPVEDD